MKLLKAKTVLTMDDGAVIRDGAVLVNDDGNIEAVGCAKDMQVCGCTEVIDYGDATLMPGLIDMHVHVGYWQTKSDSDIYVNSPALKAIMAVNELQTVFSQGVTTIRTAGDSLEGLGYAVKTALMKGFIDGPRYISSNKGITCTGGHAYIINVEADGPEGMRKAVRQQIKDGTDWIKVMASHRDDHCQLTQEEITAATEEAHNWGKKICIHAGSELTVERSIVAGVDTIEHGTFMTVEQAKRARDKGIVWVPTIVAYLFLFEDPHCFLRKIMDKPESERTVSEKRKFAMNYGFISSAAQRYKEHFAEIAATGIKICVGTDMVTEDLPLTPVGEEILHMVEYGLDPMEALKAATVNSAEVLDIENVAGRLKKGFCADLLVVGGDLTQNIKNIKDIKATYREGRLVYSAK